MSIKYRGIGEALPNTVSGLVECSASVDPRNDLATLCSAHASRFYEVLCKMFVSRAVGALTFADVDDAIQDAFVRVLKSCRDGEAMVRLPAAYILRVAINACWDKVRCLEMRKRTSSLHLGHQQLSKGIEDEENEMLLAASMSSLAQWRASAPKVLVELYELRFVVGLSQSDTAQRLAVTRKRVRCLEAALLNDVRGALRGCVVGNLPSVRAV